jgi:hypothetical protein
VRNADEKVRVDDRVESMAVVIATGVNREGRDFPRASSNGDSAT